MSRISQSENPSIPPTTTVTQPILSSDDYSTWATNIMKDRSIMIDQNASGGRTEKPMLKAGNAYHENRVKRDSHPKVSGAEINAVEHHYQGRSKHCHIGGGDQVSPTVLRDTPPGQKVGVDRNSLPKVRGVGINPVEHPYMRPNRCYIGCDRVRSFLMNSVEHPLAGPNHIYIGGDRLSTVPPDARRTGRLRGQAAAAKADKA